MTGAASFDWDASGCPILPGAIVDNLTSFGGQLRGAHRQTPLTELIRRGAAGSSGTVCEPYAVQLKFAHPRLFVHYAQGCSLAEAYYQSVQAPFQLLIVGDALCQPWARPIPFEVRRPSESPLAGVIELSIDSPELQSIGSLELYVDGLRVGVFPRDVPIRFDTRRIGDGYHQLRVVAVANQLVATQSRQILPIEVSNHGQSLEIDGPTSTVATDGDIVVTCQPEDHPIELLHHARVVGTIPAGSGSVTIPARNVGAGTIELLGVVERNGRRVHSAPVIVEVH
jgi:hypothetical protein